MYIIPFCLGMLGIFALGYGGYLISLGARTFAWPATDGIVRSSEMQTCHEPVGGRGCVTYYSALVRYVYWIDGKEFSGFRIRLQLLESSDVSFAKRDLHKYPIGKCIKVHYSPANPADSVLEPGIAAVYWFFFGLGGLLLLLAIFLGRVFLSGNKKSRSKNATVGPGLSVPTLSS
jgi:hypothetical protein